jgi:hypothetical protein
VGRIYSLAKNILSEEGLLMNRQATEELIKLFEMLQTKEQLDQAVNFLDALTGISDGIVTDLAKACFRAKAKMPLG